MNHSSRIILAKELLHCARMVLDAHCHKEAKIVVAKKRDVVRNLVIKYCPDITEEAKTYGIILSKSVIHHMFPMEKRYLATDNLSDKEIDYIECVLKMNSKQQQLIDEAEEYIKSHRLMKSSKFRDINSHLMVEIESCVLLTPQFHNWITRHVTNGKTSIQIRKNNYDLKTREQYYYLWKKLSSDKQKLNKMSKAINIKKNESVVDFISSLSKLSSFVNVNVDSNNDIKTKLAEAFYLLYNEIINNNLAFITQYKANESN